jgi:hypothetical protein
MTHVRSLLSTLSRTAASAVLALAASGAALAAGKIEVSFVQPERFTDIGRSHAEQQRALATLQEHMQSLAPQLPDGQTLRLEVLDVDLAGELDPTRTGQELRVMRGRADWPRITLRYTLTQDGRTLKSGEERLADMSYLDQATRLHMAASLPYEQRLIGRWFANRIVPAP